jgi:hypothetical protein
VQKYKLSILCGLLSAAILVAWICALGAYPGTVGEIDNAYWNQTSPLATQNQPYTAISQGTLTFTGTGTSVLKLTGTASVPCSSLLLSVSGAGVLVGSTTAAQPVYVPQGNLTLAVSNAALLYVSGGTASNVGYMTFK